MNSCSQATAPARLIYVVDDEQLMLEIAEVALMGLGYSLKKFSDPSIAYSAFAGESEKPALLLTDYAMGEMNGLELSEKCKAAHPNLKILMVSGTVGEEIASDSLVRLDGFLSKPYHPRVLIDTIQGLLSE
jgi:CheY-like chemotaxis protein